MATQKEVGGQNSSSTPRGQKASSNSTTGARKAGSAIGAGAGAGAEAREAPAAVKSWGARVGQMGKLGCGARWVRGKVLRWQRKIRVGAVVVAASAVVALLYYDWSIHRLRDFGAALVRVEEGASLAQVAEELKRHGVIAESYSLRLFARVRGVERKIQTGEYQFDEAISIAQFLQWIATGKSQAEYRFTVIEGWTFAQMRAQLAKAPKLKQTTVGLSDQELMARLGHPLLHPEGRFFPDTYHYKANYTDLSIFRQSFHLMQDKLDEVWDNRTPGVALNSKDEVLIMASIIEKESQVRDEQPMVSGVLNNRLHKGMRLQADPTVIYGLGDAYRGNITRAHLRTDTPYNTYTRKGLPPTPISLPGAGALLAAARPALTGAYYFVAMGDGRHYFSDTLEEHNRAVRRYHRLLKRKAADRDGGR